MKNCESILINTSIKILNLIVSRISTTISCLLSYSVFRPMCRKASIGVPQRPLHSQPGPTDGIAPTTPLEPEGSFQILRDRRRNAQNDLTFHLTQILTGHGCFRHYLRHMCYASIAEYIYCGHLGDTAEHTLFDFPCQEASHSEAKVFVGDRNIDPSNIQDMLCGFTDLLSRQTNSDRHDRLSAASTRSAQCFYWMIENILCRKEPNEMVAKVEVRANRQRGAH